MWESSTASSNISDWTAEVVPPGNKRRKCEGGRWGGKGGGSTFSLTGRLRSTLMPPGGNSTTREEGGVCVCVGGGGGGRGRWSICGRALLPLAISQTGRLRSTLTPPGGNSATREGGGVCVCVWGGGGGGGLCLGPALNLWVQRHTPGRLSLVPPASTVRRQSCTCNVCISSNTSSASKFYHYTIPGYSCCCFPGSSTPDAARSLPASYGPATR